MYKVPLSPLDQKKLISYEYDETKMAHLEWKTWKKLCESNVVFRTLCSNINSGFDKKTLA